MRTPFELPSGRRYHVDFDQAIEVGIPVAFAGSQPSAFGVSRASERPLETDGTVFDTRRGGSCNVSTVVIIPHCNGTHTESVRHITDDGPSVRTVVPLGLIPATVITVAPEPGFATEDTYDPPKRNEDLLITRAGLQALSSGHPDFLEAVLIRTSPNDVKKRHRDYAAEPGAYFSIPAVEYLLELGVAHLLVDVASIDRADDGGRMRVHHMWFAVAEGSTRSTDEAGAARTVTEMIFVPDTVADGPYLLQIQIAPFESDAAPSRPVLFPVMNVRSR